MVLTVGVVLSLECLVIQYLAAVSKCTAYRYLHLLLGEGVTKILSLKQKRKKLRQSASNRNFFVRINTIRFGYFA